MPIQVQKLTSFRVSNYHDTKLMASVEPLDKSQVISAADLRRISEICNQTLIYQILFAEKLADEPYQLEKAQSFIKYAGQGWSEQSHFVYLIRNANHEIIGAVDIKSADPIDAEVGYWMDEKSPGYMTNVIIGLIAQARLAGYKSLVGMTKTFNDKSRAVLERAGMKFVEQQTLPNGHLYNKFRITF